MANSTHGYLLEVRRGASGTDHLELPIGRPIPPLSVGLRGQWRIEADGVLDVHGYLYFDGGQLFVQSANIELPLRVNGQPMGAAWAPVGAPCTIAIGDARLVFHDAAEGLTRATYARPAAGTPGPPLSQNDLDATRVREEDFDGETQAFLPAANAPLPIPQPTPIITRQPRDYSPAPGAPSRGATSARVEHDDRTGDIALPPAFQDRDDEPTKAIPIPPEMPMAPPPMPMPMPMPTPMFAPQPMPPPSKSPSPHTPQPMVATHEIGPHAPTPTAHATVKIAAKRGDSLADKLKPILAKLGEDWRATSLPKKAILGLLPFAFIMVIVAFSDKEQPVSRRKSAPTSASASATEKPRATESAKPPPTPSAPPTDSVEPPPTTTAPPVVPPVVPPPVATVAPTPTTVASTATTPTDSKTMERAAVDAVVSGDLDTAAKLYAQLAAQHPDNPAYVEAAKILKRKTSK